MQQAEKHFFYYNTTNAGASTTLSTSYRDNYIFRSAKHLLYSIGSCGDDDEDEDDDDDSMMIR